MDLLLINFRIQFLMTAGSISIVHRGFQGRSVPDLIWTAHLMEIFELWDECLVLRSSGSLGYDSAIKWRIISIAHLSLWRRQFSSESFAFTRSLGGDCNLLLLLRCGVSIHTQSSPVLSVGLDAGVLSINGVLRLETPLEYFRVVIRRIMVYRIVNCASRIYR